MSKYFILLLCLTFNPALLAEVKICSETDSDEVCRRKLRTSFECSLRVLSIMAEYEGYRDSFFKGKSNGKPLAITLFTELKPAEILDYDIKANLDGYEVYHKAALDKIRSFASKFDSKNVSDTAELNEALLEVEAELQKTSNDLIVIASAESGMLALLDKARDFLKQRFSNDTEDMAFITSDRCDVLPLALLLDDAKEASEELFYQIDRTRKYVTESRATRVALLGYVLSAVKSSLTMQLDQRVVDDLVDLSSYIRAILRANEISDQYELWYQGIRNDRNRRLLSSIYHQHEEPLRLYTLDLGTALNYKKQLQLATKSHPRASSDFMRRLDGIIETIQGDIDRLASRGWQGTMDRQKMFANRYVQMSDRFPANCVNGMKGYLAQANKVTGIDDYRRVELMYMEATKICQKR